MGILDERSVVVTGAGRGLGAAYARLAAAQGAAVVVNDVEAALASSVVAQIVSDGGRAVADNADISTWAGAGRLVQRCLSEYGAIDGLVNNAAIFRLATPWEQDPGEFRQVLETNLLGTAYCGMHALWAMVERGRGSIVNVTSGSQAGSAAMAAYGASKGGVAALTYCWAADVVGTGIRVNAVSPNAHTRMADEFERYLAEHDRGEQARGQNVGKTPEINAPAVVYLLSDAAAGINGQVLRIDGNELSLMSHPNIVEPVVNNPQWTVEAVAAAFAGPLGKVVQPLGLRARPSMNREVQSSASREIG
jgi:NAD(P)-dependent dehydrogenase (short-subunit alcohol dehydrogenase family)